MSDVLKELLPCPFCGSDDIHTTSGRGTGFRQYHCNSCHAKGPVVDAVYDGDKSWNTRAQSTQSPVEQPPQTVAGDSFFDGKDYSAALGKIEYLLNQERQHLSFMTEENQPDYFLDPIKQDIASYEAAIELIKQAALTRHEGA